MIDKNNLPDWAKQALDEGVIELTEPQPDVIFQTHGLAVCDGEPCCVHNPSDHKMRDWPLVHRTDRQIMVIALESTDSGMKASHRPLVMSERVCSHGQTHPDPDSLYFIGKMGGMITSVVAYSHDCDGCCDVVYDADE